MNPQWLWPAVVVSAVLALAALVVALRLRIRLAETVRRNDSLQSDLRALCNAAVQVGERTGAMERQLRQLSERQEELGLRQEELDRAEPEERAYQQAIKLVHKGASVEELMEICNLTRGEAELVSMMNRLESGS